MIFAFIQSSIGAVGRAILAFYLANSFIINGVILMYAFIVFIAQKNYYFALNKIFIELRLIDQNEKNKLIRKVNHADYKNLHWDLVRKGIWFPFISAPKKWTFRLCTANYLKSEFSLEKINQFIKESGK
jgi:hypothetical protein